MPYFNQMVLIYIIISLILGAVGSFLVLRPKLKTIQKLDYETSQKNQEILFTNQELTNKLIKIKEDIAVNLCEKNNVAKALDDVQHQLEVHASLARTMSSQQEELLGKALETAAEKASARFQQAEEAYQQEYINSLQEYSAQFAAVIQGKQKEQEELEARLITLKASVQAAIEANLREEKKKTNLDFYKIGLTEKDIMEVQKLREVTFFLRNGRPINKAIWEAYYRNLTTDMINRVVGSGTRCGIYLITNLLDNKKYIGQSTSIGERFKSHIKCGLGIDAPSNKIYSAMQKDGVENFSFEVIEECKPAELNEKEKYWIQYYQSNLYGYNMSVGGSRAN